MCQALSLPHEYGCLGSYAFLKNHFYEHNVESATHDLMMQPNSDTGERSRMPSTANFLGVQVYIMPKIYDCKRSPHGLRVPSGWSSPPTASPLVVACTFHSGVFDSKFGPWTKSRNGVFVK